MSYLTFYKDSEINSGWWVGGIVYCFSLIRDTYNLLNITKFNKIKMFALYKGNTLYITQYWLMGLCSILIIYRQSDNYLMFSISYIFGLLSGPVWKMFGSNSGSQNNKKVRFRFFRKKQALYVSENQVSMGSVRLSFKSVDIHLTQKQ